MTKIELDPVHAAVLLDIVDLLSGVGDTDEVMKALVAARYAVPWLVEAFEAAGIDPDEIERPEMKLVAGSKAPPTDDAE